MNTEITTTSGTLRGLDAEGALVFRNVPYAAPPFGALRFAPPEPARPWSGVRDATTHGPVAPQPASRLRAAMGDFTRPQSEDCLTLTIATPDATGSRPVIVWLHGGAYMSGAGSLDWYDGSRLAKEGDVVVVGVNYRLGALGFLHRPDVGADNNALADMIAALRWVQAEIAPFGGDPTNVTVMGQSAGAHAILCLLTMPEAAGFFHRAIMLSTPPSLLPLASDAAGHFATQFLDHLGIPADAPDLATRLRTVSVAAIMDAQMRVVRGAARFADVSPPFIPTFDELADVSAFLNAAADGASARGTDIMIGTTREEMHAFFAPDPAMAEPDPAQVATRFEALAGSADAIEHYRARRPGGTLTDLLGDLVTDHVFLFPSLQFAEAVNARGRRAFVYQFDWSAPANPFRACHCIELPFVFGNDGAWDDAGMLKGADPAQIAALSATMRGAIAAFACIGDPGLRWSPYSPPDRMTMIFGPLVGMQGDPAGATARGHFPIS